jgi:hypothetical protein
MVLLRLSDWGDRGNGRSRDAGSGVHVDILVDLTVGSLLRTVTGDVASLTALVAGLASSVQGTTVRGSAITGDVTELATSVALHGLSLAVASEVVRSAALVAGSRARSAANKATTATISAKATAAGSNGTAAAHVGASRVGASASQVADLTAVVATTAGAGTAQPKGRAVSLDMTKTLTVVALLSLGGAGKGAAVRLMAGLLAVVAEALRRRADLSVVTNVATLVAGTARKRRHGSDVGYLVLNL